MLNNYKNPHMDYINWKWIWGGEMWYIGSAFSSSAANLSIIFSALCAKDWALINILTLHLPSDL